MTTHDKLHARLVTFGSSLTESQREELRAILDDLAKLAYDVGEVYKMSAIALIPSKTQSGNCSVGGTPIQTFTPAAKTGTTKGDPLAELLHNMSEADKAKLASGLKTKLETK